MTETLDHMIGCNGAGSPLRPASDLTLDLVNRLLAVALQGRSVVAFELLSGGLINTNFKIHVEAMNDPFVLRFYARDPDACQKEIDLYQLIQRTVPAPEVVYGDPGGHEGAGPFVLLRYVEGIPFRQLRQTRDADAIAQAACEIGKTLAAIGKYQFSESGWFGPGLAIGGEFIEGPDSIARFCDTCLASPNFLRRVERGLARRVHEFAWKWSPRLSWLDDERSLVHSDFGSRNVLVRQVSEKWRVAAVIDWEFAFSGSPLFDVGNFLRYERKQRPLVEPHFSRGFVAGGGTLREDWRALARVIDLTALCEHFTRDQLPPDVKSELLELVRATIEDRDPS